MTSKQQAALEEIERRETIVDLERLPSGTVVVRTPDDCAEVDEAGSVVWRSVSS